ISLADDGDVAYWNHIRVNDGRNFQIGPFSGATKIGGDWFYFDSSTLSRFNSSTILPIDANFAARNTLLTAYSGLTFLGVADLSTARPLSLAGPVKFDTNGYSIVMSGGISGIGSFEKTGAGTAILTSANAYTGATTISAGTLLVNGSTAMSSLAT